MNAILVFDPSNDLLFVKSNQQFRSRLLKYARLNGLLAAGASKRRWKPLASSSASCSSSSADEAAETRRPGPAATTLHNKSSNGARSNQTASSRVQSISARANGSPPPPEVSDDVSRAGATRARHRTRKRTRQRLAGRNKLHRSQMADDTSKCYTDILMLLLTPYVASLRLSNDLRGQQLDAYAELRPATTAKQSHGARQGGGAASGRANNAARHPAQRAARDDATGGQAHEELLAKFMSSISINHECRANEPMAALGVGGPGAEWAPIESSDEERERQHSLHPTAFSTLQMPVDCLQDCQVVYCRLFDFIFIYMQELTSVSSFKLRLLQKRVDLFARLALLLFGRALNSLRPASLARRQSQLLRRAYDCWFANQFRPELFLEANERLVLGSHIGQLCGETLRKVSAELRARQTAASQAGRGAETHQHALLFADSKLVSRFSCLNANPLTRDDLILSLILLKAFNADHNNEMPPIAEQDQEDEKEEEAARCARDPASKFHYKSHYQTDRHTSQICGPANCASSAARGRRAGHPCGEERGAEMPHLLSIFLASSEPLGTDAQVYVPHTLRFVVLARGVTLMLISEISNAYLNDQLSRVQSLLLDFSRHSLADGERVGAELDDNATAESTKQPRSPRRQLRLSQLAHLTQCISAIKSYFFAPRLADLLAHSAPTSSNEQLLGMSRAGEPAEPSASSASLLASLFKRSSAQRHRNQQADGQRASTTLERPRRGADGSRDWLDDYDEPQGQPNAAAGHQQPWRMVERLEPAGRRLCRHLLRKLAELAQNNVQTYMRQTFGMALDEHKREALLSSVGATVRQSFSELVLEPQLARLAGQSADGHEYLRELSEQHDRVKLVARRELNDYLDYLAVKAQCNVTLGAPLTHDLSSITGFIYVDRARQELLISPLSRSRCASLSWAELVEGDFEASIERQRRREAARVSSLDEREDGHSSELSSDEHGAADSSDELQLDERGEEADQSESSEAGEPEERVSRAAGPASSESTTSDSIESIIYTGSRPLSKQDLGKLKQNLWPKAASKAATHRQRQYLGTSQDISAADSSSASSQQSVQMLGASRSSGPIFGQCAVSSDLHLDRAHLMARFQATCGDEQQAERRRSGANEQLVQAFSAFIYNRLASGQTSSFSQNCGQSQLSYFMWLKRQTDDKVIKLEPHHRLQTSRKLAAHFRSLPNITCDDFFSQLASSLVGGLGQSLNAAHSTSSSSLWSSQQSIGGSSSAGSSGSGRKRRVKVICQVRELHPKTGRQLCKRQLTRVREEEESADGAEEEADEAIEFDIASSSSTDVSARLIRSKSMLDMDEERDFVSFMRKQRSSHTSNKPARPSRRAANIEREVSCYELICIHDRSLLVHKNQATFEAQRLAVRLAELLQSRVDI